MLLRCEGPKPPHVLDGQKPNPSGTVACQLSPAPDIPRTRVQQLCAAASNRSKAALFDHLVGDREQRRGDCDAKCLGGLEVDREVKLGRHLYGQIGRLFAPQNAVHIEGG